MFHRSSHVIVVDLDGNNVCANVGARMCDSQLFRLIAFGEIEISIYFAWDLDDG